MGIDLGTSCTKIVIRTPFLAGGRATPVPLSRGDTPLLRFLAPTAIVLGPDDSIEIPNRSAIPPTWTSLKVAVMEHPDNVEGRARLAAYLALVGRKAQTWFVESQRRIVGSRELRWTWNLGIPSNGCRTDSPVDSAFKVILTAAKRLSDAEGSIRLDDARDLIAQDLAKDPTVSTVPEVIAEAAGYARSYHREPGLHILVDVGASTLDVCAFNLTRTNGVDGYGILTAAVERRGIHELHRGRLQVLAARDRRRLAGNSGLNLSNFLAEIPGSISQYLVERRPSEQEVRFDKVFARACTNQIMWCLATVRHRRYRHSPAWRSGIPTFICGGGSLCELYKETVEAASNRCVKTFSEVAPLRIKELPVPRELDAPNLDAATFSRLAVAYGLSFDTFDIGEVVSPDRIPDEPPQRYRELPEMISKDHV